MDLSEFFVIFWVWAKWKKPNSWPKKKTNFSIDADCWKFSSKRNKTFLPLWLSSKRSNLKRRRRKNWTTKNVSQSFSKKSDWICTSKLRTSITLFSNARTLSTSMQWICFSWRKNCFTFCVRNPFVVPKCSHWSKTAEICQFCFLI